MYLLRIICLQETKHSTRKVRLLNFSFLKGIKSNFLFLFYICISDYWTQVLILQSCSWVTLWCVGSIELVIRVYIYAMIVLLLTPSHIPLNNLFSPRNVHSFLLGVTPILKVYFEVFFFLSSFMYAISWNLTFLQETGLNPQWNKSLLVMRLQ